MTVEKIKGKVWVTINGVTKNVSQWAKEYRLSEKTLGSRLQSGWSEEHLFDPPGLWKPAPCFNEHFFDVINNEKKAYWLGFIWCDGYINRKVNKRHDEENRDGEYRSLQLSGKIQGLKILHYIYDDATVYLDRKYEKFLSIVKKLEGLDEVQTV